MSKRVFTTTIVTALFTFVIATLQVHADNYIPAGIYGTPISGLPGTTSQSDTNTTSITSSPQPNWGTTASQTSDQQGQTGLTYPIPTYQTQSQPGMGQSALPQLQATAPLSPLATPAQNVPLQMQNLPQNMQNTPQNQLPNQMQNMQQNPALNQLQPQYQQGQTPKPPAASAPGEYSAIEQAMLTSGTSMEKAAPSEFKIKTLQQFGYSYFRPESQGFAAMTDIPVGPDYILGAGDRIILTLWGSVEGTYELEVNRSGEIVLPKVGPVNVAGVTFGQLPKLLSGQLGKILRDFQLNVTMGKLRLIKIYVVGEVNAPGDYSISSLSTLINALTAAGGPTRNGSLRSINIHRNGKLVETVDLYDFFLNGDKSRDIRLQPGDTIFVPSIGPVVGIAGNVRRPAIYELKDEKTLKDALKLADGIIPTGYLQRLQIARVEDHDKKIVTDVDLDPKTTGKSLDNLAAGIGIKDMDLVKIFPIDSTLRGYVRLDGYVLRPGDYALKPGMRVDQLLPLDNMLPEYYTEAGQIIRLYPPDYHPEILFFNVGKALAKDPANDPELQEFDTVRIFSRWEMEEMPHVRISGEIQKPGDYRLFDKMRVRDLLMFAGNPKLTAYLKDAEITRIDKTTSSVTSYPIRIDLGEALKGNPKDNILLQQFDELTVRKIPNWAEENDRYIALKGEFVFPGVYPIFKGERLSSVIRRAGGFTTKAYLNGAKFTRAQVRDLQQKRMQEFVASAELEVNSKMAELASTSSSQEELAANKASLEGIKRNLQILKGSKAEGRVVINLDQPDKFTGSPYDVEVMGGDTLEVPQNSNSVSVLGRVVNPTSFVYLNDESVDFYLKQAGGTTKDSDDDEIYVVRANGSIFSRQQFSSLGPLFGGGFQNQPITSGDTIVVPQNYEKTAWLRTIKDITTIMSQIAITAGTVLLGLK